MAAFGPSGVGVWSTPTVDAKRGRLYAATSDNYSVPATPLSDAVVALDLKSGRIVWSKQFTAGDVFSGACPSKAPSCPDGPGPDYDFAASAILTTRAGGDVILAGQKSGIVHALDPDKQGAILWQTRVGKGGTSGGVQWGMAADGEQVYAATSDMDRTFQNRPLDPQRFVVDRNAGGGLTALRIADGTKAWSAAPIPCAADAPPGCNPSNSAAVTAIPGVVFAASNDGHVRAYAAADGKLLWDFNTMRDFETVNGVKARGGSIDGPGAVVAGGMVFVTPDTRATAACRATCCSRSRPSEHSATEALEPGADLGHRSFSQRAETVHQPHLLHRPAPRLQQPRAAHQHRHRLRARDRHVQPVAAEQELEPARNVVAAAARHREEDDRRFAPLELVHRPDLDAGGQRLQQAAHLHVVGRDDEDVGGRERPADAVRGR